MSAHGHDPITSALLEVWALDIERGRLVSRWKIGSLVRAAAEQIKLLEMRCEELEKLLAQREKEQAVASKLEGLEADWGD